MEPKFIVDANVGKLVRWLRMMGFDALFFDELDDGRMVKTALAENRTIITKDTGVMKRRAVASGRVKAILVSGDNPEAQMQAVVDALDLNAMAKPFTRCIECNAELREMSREEARDLVPPRVYEIQDQYMACPSCHRIYWRGTHWKSMSGKLHQFDSAQARPVEGG